MDSGSMPSSIHGYVIAEPILLGDPTGSSSSNWILMSCQPHWVTSGQSNSGHKQIHISKLCTHTHAHSHTHTHTHTRTHTHTHTHQPSVKPIYKTNHFTNIKHTYTNIRHKFFNSPFNITLLKQHIRPRHAGIVDHSA